jgi:hypothetical protein
MLKAAEYRLLETEQTSLYVALLCVPTPTIATDMHSPPVSGGSRKRLTSYSIASKKRQIGSLPNETARGARPIQLPLRGTKARYEPLKYWSPISRPSIRGQHAQILQSPDGKRCDNGPDGRRVDAGIRRTVNFSYGQFNFWGEYWIKYR